MSWFALSTLLLGPVAHARDVLFAGHLWEVKSGVYGPGPNTWSDAPDAVWVDGDGALHLRITEDGGVWSAAEVRTKVCTGYGLHRFKLDGALSMFDPSVVGAVFLYGDDTHELDVEFSRWGDPTATNEANFAVQPATVERFPLALTGTYTTHTIAWWPTQATFASVHGHHDQLPSPGHLIHAWSYAGPDLPAVTDALRVHINLWMYQGQPPTNGQEVELVVHEAELPPLHLCP